MSDTSVLGQITALLNEKQQVVLALDNLNNGGRITTMTIGPPPSTSPMEATPAFPAIVATQDITYPEQMVDAIKTALQARQDAINQALAGFGVTIPT